MTSLPRVQVSAASSESVDLSRDSDLHMCAMSLIHTTAPQTTLKYAKMIYSVERSNLRPFKKHGHVYITDSWRVRSEYRLAPTSRESGDAGDRMRSILLGYLSPASRRCVEVLLSNPGLLGCAP